jgi:hypothetical protein
MIYLKKFFFALAKLKKSTWEKKVTNLEFPQWETHSHGIPAIVIMW